MQKKKGKISICLLSAKILKSFWDRLASTFSPIWYLNIFVKNRYPCFSVLLTVDSWNGDFGPTKTKTKKRIAYLHKLYSCRPPVQRSDFKGKERYSMRDCGSCNNPAAFAACCYNSFHAVCSAWALMSLVSAILQRCISHPVKWCAV